MVGASKQQARQKSVKNQQLPVKAAAAEGASALYGPVSIVTVLLIVLVVAVLGYLVATLIFPERF